MNPVPKVKLIVAAHVALLACAATCEPVVPVPVGPSAPDAGPPDDGGKVIDNWLPPEDAATACGRACSRMRRLSCPGGQLSPGGANCETVCENQNTSGIGSYCTSYVEQIQGRLLPDGGRECDEDELQRAFEACE